MEPRERPQSLPGLLLHTVRLRWDALGRRGRRLAVAGLFLTGLGLAFGAGVLVTHGCPASESPCATRSPCHRAAADEDAPCPYAARAQAEAEDEGADDDGPPCHRR